MGAMLAKMKVTSVTTHPDGNEDLVFNAVGKSEAYTEDGSDENNTFAKFTPMAEIKLRVANPALYGQFLKDEEYYVNFSKAE